MAAPQLLSRKANGVSDSPAPGSVSAAQSSSDAPKAPRTKAAPEGEKVVIRRLPPAMTEQEFVAILGDDWKLGNGRVDWFSYWPGKISQHPSKPSRPSRAYLHVMKRDELLALLQTVQNAVWEDAKESHTDPALVLPPTAEFSVYKKVPSDKKRSDNRQGTIDQDPEFMAFLESLANPDANKGGDGDQAAEDAAKAEKTTTTPLVEFLREKKAARVKEAAAAKSAKHSRQESQGGKGKPSLASSEEPKTKHRESRSEKSSGKSPEKVKILTKKAAAAAEAAADAAKAVALKIQTQQAQAQTSTQSSSQDGPTRSRRAGIAAAARILQRDLGLSPGNAHRKARQEAAKAEADSKVSVPKETAKEVAPVTKEPAVPSISVDPSTSPAPSTSSKGAQPSSSGRTRNRKRGAGEDAAKAKENKTVEAPSHTPPKPPIILMKKKDAQPPASLQTPPSAAPQPPKSAPTPKPAATASTTPAAVQSVPVAAKSGPAKQGSAPKKSNSSAPPAPGATRAFLKHANQSQGVTESLLKEAMQVFGSVTSVEIDRKKGFAYVDFVDHESLVKAMAASPVNVAQATVQILERKDMGKKAPANAKNPTPAPLPPAVAEASTPRPTTPATPTTEKTGGAQEKRGHRRRGGRGRDKESGGGKDGGGGGSKNTDASGGSARAASTVTQSSG
ncbi:Smg-4/UPF3 family-domain-containing protein [Podospora didyma]|uniref:Smg-4/UPF3 family-domain-containing protein n=1 Tax=Podospora didyma TaxID=330526 RepID=A0AAE0NU53_9PEZI|nr:Smg-4/UPF3 family-domain-containing protein [Podospora didyma]